MNDTTVNENVLVNEKANKRILYVLVLTLIITVMNGTVFNVALPTIISDLGLSMLQGSWIGTAYLTIFAVGTLTYGKLTEKFKISTLITFGLLTLCIGSIIGLVTQNFTLLIISRLIQAVGSSVMPTMGQLIPYRLFPAKKRGQALGLVAAGMALGGLLGALVSGVITTFLGWRWLFVLPLIVLFVLPVFRHNLRGEALPLHPETRIDWFGGGLLLLTVASLMLTFTLLNIWMVLVTALLIVAMIFWMRRSTQPFLQLSIFANKQFSILLVITVMFGILCFGIPFILPLMLADIQAADAAAISLVIFPGTVIAALMARTGGRLIDKKGNAFMVKISVIPIIILLIIMSVSCGWSMIFTALLMVFFCVAQVFLQTALNNSVSHTLSAKESGVGFGMFTMTTYISGALANVLIGLLVNFFTLTPVQLSPVLINSNAYAYSNALLAMIVPAILIGLVFIVFFRKHKADKVITEEVIDAES